MVESVIGLLKQNQRLTQATRCYEGFLSGTQFPTVRLLSPFDILWLFSALMARNTPLAILFFIQAHTRLWCLLLCAFFIGYYWLQRKPKPHPYVKHNRTSNGCYGR